MRRLSGFSLMEMMTVLLIVSVVAAASAPMISKKMSVAPAGAGGAGAGGCQWETVDGEGIAYNTEGNDDQTVIIGTSAMPKGLKSRFHITSADNNSHMTLQYGNKVAHVSYRNGTIGLGTIVPTSHDAIVIGSNATSKNKGIAIGSNAHSKDVNSIVIGSGASCNRMYSNGQDAVFGSVAIGDNATVKSYESIAIGGNATADFGNATAVGVNATAQGGAAFGHNARTLGASVAIGPDSASGVWDTAVGYLSHAHGGNSIALGMNSVASHFGDIALGESANASGVHSMAIGKGALASHLNSVAIGSNLYRRSTVVTTTAEDQIVLGTSQHTVYIPGNLIVGGKSYFGSSLRGDDLAVAGQWGNNGIQGFIGDIEGNEKFDIINPGGKYNFRHSSEAPGYDMALNFLKGNGWESSPDSVTSSDRRLKNVGKAFVGGLKELKKLDLFHYTYKKDKSNTPHVGVMAQDLQKVFPDAVTKGEDGFLRIRMEDMFYALVNAVKELASMFDKQDEKIVQLEKENKQLQKTVADLEKRLAKLERNK